MEPRRHIVNGSIRHVSLDMINQPNNVRPQTTHLPLCTSTPSRHHRSRSTHGFARSSYTISPSCMHVGIPRRLVACCCAAGPVQSIRGLQIGRMRRSIVRKWQSVLAFPQVSLYIGRKFSIHCLKCGLRAEKFEVRDARWSPDGKGLILLDHQTFCCAFEATDEPQSEN